MQNNKLRPRTHIHAANSIIDAVEVALCIFHTNYGKNSKFFRKGAFVEYMTHYDVIPFSDDEVAQINETYVREYSAKEDEELHAILESLQITPNLDENQKKLTLELLTDFRDISPTTEHPCGDMAVSTLEIHGHSNGAHVVRRMLDETLFRNMTKMLEKRNLTSFRFPSSGVCFQTKKDGTVQFRIDYTNVNAVTRKTPIHSFHRTTCSTPLPTANGSVALIVITVFGKFQRRLYSPNSIRIKKPSSNPIHLDMDRTQPRWTNHRLRQPFNDTR